MWYFLLSAFTILFSASGYSQSTKHLKTALSLAQRIDQTRPCIVRIEATWGEVGKPPIRTEQGTGFIVNSDGIVVTAKHIFDSPTGEPPNSISIDLPVEPSDKLSPRVLEAGNFAGTSATVIDSDTPHDIVLLRPSTNPLSNLKSGIKINGIYPKVRRAGVAHLVASRSASECEIW
jgi:hypothetical protein